MPFRSNSSPQTAQVLETFLSGSTTWRYGYDLCKETGLKSGTLYPILMRLHEQGWLETKWEEAERTGKPPRHLYRLTAMGKTQARSLLRGPERVGRPVSAPA